MKFFTKVRLLPLLVFFASLSFVVRVGDIVTGEYKWGEPVAEVSRAMAQEEVDAEPPPMAPRDDAAMDMDSGMENEIFAEEDMAEEDMDELDFGALDEGFSEAELELLQALADRREKLDRRAKQLDIREAVILAAEKKVDRKIEELAQLRSEIEALLSEQNAVQENRLRSLVKVYENMKAADAARIFNTMELDVLLAVIGRMNERKMAPILAEMNPERAQTITIRLAEQRRLPDALGSGEEE